MNSYRVILSENYLEHNGILGMKWGVRNGPPYPLGSGQHSKSEIKAGYKRSLGGKKNESLYGRNDTVDKKDSKGSKSGKNFELTDQQKKYLKTGATVVAALLVSYGGYKLATNAHFKAMVGKGIDKIKRTPDINTLIENSGPDIIKKDLWNMSNAELDEALKDIPDFEQVLSKPGNLGGLTNPTGSGTNCKQVSEAVCKRWTGADAAAVADSNHISGNLHDYVENRLNPKGIEWLNELGGISPDPSGDSSEKVSRAILKKFNDGDCGMISVDWDKSELEKRHLRLPEGLDGHAFNWYISKDKVVFYDDQPDPPLTNAIEHLQDGLININKEIEIVKITKDAFA